MKIQTIIPILNPQSSFFNKTITSLHVQTVTHKTQGSGIGNKP